MIENCICRHFYAPTYNREILTRTDHMNLLATPKGYRWYGPDGELLIKKRAFRGKSGKRKKKEQKEHFPGMIQFMNNIWSIITPELLHCIKEILEEEFGMSPQKAVQFIARQYVKSHRLLNLDICGCCCITEEQSLWANNVAGCLSLKLTQFLAMMTKARRNKRTRLLQKKLLDRLQGAIGVDFCADSPINRFLWRIVDGLAVWLSSMPGEDNIKAICSNALGEVCSGLCLV